MGVVLADESGQVPIEAGLIGCADDSADLVDG
jgi:hypothetical protein